MNVIECKNCKALNYQTSHECHNCKVKLYEGTTTFTTNTGKLIDRAEKQDKLIELLNKIKEIIDRDYNSYIVSMLEESERYVEIKKLIKENENEGY